ncbi:MAG TPA: tRNA 4-thiouridine(8) synthase ThiI [Candidatus Coprosoma intestinipullorum]|uniref:Probable tRNA sulfurtransferase n=1 Tax=Candidatus Coprosoma intestinipullorum TaxID=2840752 RepID=A0A9D0ZRV3_9FIRM|nr:tRNA 4-thiouridine(8) synthase ThiI [Candidatus Coprosoma intestinipullorum]
MNELIMIKYGELTTKKDNRKYFVKTLTANIEATLKDEKAQIIKNNVRMYIYCENADKIEEKLKKVFGIHSISKAYKVNNNIEDVLKKSLEIMDRNKKTFKVITSRADKTFKTPSMEYSSNLGALILKNSHFKVDVHNPDIILHVEIRTDGTYVYTSEIKGAGGYPVGVQGKGLLMLSGGIDSPVAGYLALKRGVSIECMYFESPPHTSFEAKNKVLSLAKILNEYSGKIKVHVVPFTKIQEEIYKKCPDTYMITIMRRMMYRIAEKYAKKINAHAIFNGESIGQVASQTLESMVCVNNVVSMPVIRPVACFDKLEIIALAEKIGAYETSILPYEDCCTIFVPKHPVIKPKLENCISYEQNLDYEKLIDEAIDNIEVITNFEKPKYEDLL